MLLKWEIHWQLFVTLQCETENFRSQFVFSFVVRCLREVWEREREGSVRSARIFALNRGNRRWWAATRFRWPNRRMANFAKAAAGKPFLIYQLGTNNWQREGEFAPGSGILHQSHHDTYNQMDGIKCYSMYPSEKQSPHEDPLVEVFKLEHQIPICESASPVSSYRWHTMSEEEFTAYRERLEEAVYEQMAAAEEREGTHISLAVAHHSFLNPVVVRNVLRRRVKEGRPKAALVCFVHGTALKMYVHEKDGKSPEEFPLRFLPFLNDSKVFDDVEGDGVQLCYAISEQQIKAFREIFPAFPEDRVVISPNGINQQVFHPIEGATIQGVLSTYSHQPFAGVKGPAPEIDASKYDNLVIMVSKFAAWKRVPALLHAASSYEKVLPKTATVIVGTGPPDAQKELQCLAYEELGLQNTFFLGPQPHPVLAELYSVASVGCFPSYKEPFGLVFIEAAACGCPVIGANSGGPKDFVTDAIGTLVEETDNIKELGSRVEAAIKDAITLDWRKTKSSACIELVDKKYSVLKQCTELIESTRKRLDI